MGRIRRWALASAVVVTALLGAATGCTGGDGPGGAEPPAEVEAPVEPGPPDDVSEVALPDEVMVATDPDDDLELTGYWSSTPNRPRGVLYGEPGRTDPIAGRTLLLATTEGSAEMAGPSTPYQERVPLELGGTEPSYLAHDGVWTWAIEECGEDCSHFAIGRGLADEEVIAALRGSRIAADGSVPRPGTVPEGLVPLAIGERGDVVGAGSRQVQYRTGDTSVQVFTARARPGLAWLWAFWVDDRSTTTRIRGHAGWHGPTGGSYLRYDDVSIWQEEGHLVAVVVQGPGDRDPMASTVASLELRPFDRIGAVEPP